MEYPSLISPYVTNGNIPLEKTWRYKQRHRMRESHSLERIYQNCADQYVASTNKDRCLQDLVVFINNRINRIISQRYQLVMFTQSHDLPLDITHHICMYIPLQFYN